MRKTAVCDRISDIGISVKFQVRFKKIQKIFPKGNIFRRSIVYLSEEFSGRFSGFSINFHPQNIPNGKEGAVIANKIIDVRDVRKVYRIGQTSLHALDGVDLTIEEGEFCCIVGRSGSGKSTLLNMMAGLEPPTSGQIIIAGKHIEKMNESELILFRQKNVGFVFQSFNLLGSMTALENTALPLEFRGVSKKVREKKAKEMLDAVGIGSHKNHKPAQMSGGQQQRVGLARALVLDPKIIFADEPTGNLDTKTTAEMMSLITGLMRQRNQTFVMVTHDPTMAQYADKVVHILDGKIVKLEVQKPAEFPTVEEEQKILSALGEEKES